MFVEQLLPDKKYFYQVNSTAEYDLLFLVFILFVVAIYLFRRGDK